MFTGGVLSEVTARQVETADQAILVEVRLTGSAEGYYMLTEIQAPRELAEALGLGPPDGFRQEELPLSSSEAKDPEVVGWTW